MSFTIVSELQGVTSRDSRRTPHEALRHASALVRSGVEKVWVYDESGRFVSASALSQMAQQQAATTQMLEPAPDEDAVDLLASVAASSQSNHKIGATAPSSTANSKLAANRGARVFRIAPRRD